MILIHIVMCEMLVVLTGIQSKTINIHLQLKVMLKEFLRRMLFVTLDQVVMKSLCGWEISIMKFHSKNIYL